VRSEGFYVNEKSTDTSWDRTSDLQEERVDEDNYRVLVNKLIPLQARCGPEGG